MTGRGQDKQRLHGRWGWPGSLVAGGHRDKQWHLATNTPASVSQPMEGLGTEANLERAPEGVGSEEVGDGKCGQLFEET